jgi:hypothetical protein
MLSHTTKKFWDYFNILPKNIQKQAILKYKIWTYEVVFKIVEGQEIRVKLSSKKSDKLIKFCTQNITNPNHDHKKTNCCAR